jgi:hypothetical protein
VFSGPFRLCGSGSVQMDSLSAAMACIPVCICVSVSVSEGYHERSGFLQHVDLILPTVCACILCPVYTTIYFSV